MSRTDVNNMKMTVIGGGGVRSMFLARSIASRAESLGIKELVFMDNDEVKLNIFGKMAKKISSLIAPSLKFIPLRTASFPYFFFSSTTTD